MTFGDRIRELRKAKNLTLRDVARRPGLAAIEFLLDVGLGQFEARRAAVHDTTICRPVALAE